MNEEIRPIKIQESGQVKSRPVLLSVLCLFSFVFLGMLSIFFFTGMFFSGWITSVTNQYFPKEAIQQSHILIITGAGFLLHLLAIAGSIMIWNLKKTGFYMLGFSCIIITIYQTFRPQISLSTTALYIILILLFGLFFRRLH